METVRSQALTQTIEHLDRQPAWITWRLHHDGRHGRHQHRFGDPTLTVPRNAPVNATREMPPLPSMAGWSMSL
jgi:hypothetical protein